MHLLITGIILTNVWKGSSGDDTSSKPDMGAQFLFEVMNQLHNDRVEKPDDEVLMIDRQTEKSSKLTETHYENPMKILGPTPLPPYKNDKDYAASSVSVIKESATVPPPPPLSKDELLALYEAAINKGATLDLASLFSGSTTANQLHTLENFFSSVPSVTGASSTGTIPGYYYYFYPIQSFNKDQLVMNKDEKIQTAESAVNNHQKKPQMSGTVPTTMMVLDTVDGHKSVEPLFVAMASFIGMALMFIFSILFLPKFGTLRSRGIYALKNAPDEFAGLTKLVLEAIDGKDCSERIICEVGRAVKKMNLTKKPLRILEMVLPQQFRKHLQQIRKAASKKGDCSNVLCVVKKHPLT